MANLSRVTLTVLLAPLFFAVVVHGQANFTTGPSFYAAKWANVPTPRGIMMDSFGDVLLVSRSVAQIFAVFDDPEGTPVVLQITNETGLELNHALTYSAGYLYASSKSSVYRWPYTPGQRRTIDVPAQLVVHNIPGSESAAFITRPVIFDARMNFYVGVGAGVNTPPEPDSNRTRIRKFGVLNSDNFPIDFDNGEVHRQQICLVKILSYFNKIVSPYHKPILCISLRAQNYLAAFILDSLDILNIYHYQSPRFSQMASETK